MLFIQCYGYLRFIYNKYFIIIVIDSILNIKTVSTYLTFNILQYVYIFNLLH